MAGEYPLGEGFLQAGHDLMDTFKTWGHLGESSNAEWGPEARSKLHPSALTQGAPHVMKQGNPFERQALEDAQYKDRVKNWPFALYAAVMGEDGLLSAFGGMTPGGLKQGHNQEQFEKDRVGYDPSQTTRLYRGQGSDKPEYKTDWSSKDKSTVRNVPQERWGVDEYASGWGEYTGFPPQFDERQKIGIDNPRIPSAPLQQDADGRWFGKYPDQAADYYRHAVAYGPEGRATRYINHRGFDENYRYNEGEIIRDKDGSPMGTFSEHTGLVFDPEFLRRFEGTPTLNYVDVPNDQLYLYSTLLAGAPYARDSMNRQPYGDEFLLPNDLIDKMRPLPDSPRTNYLKTNNSRPVGMSDLEIREAKREMREYGKSWEEVFPRPDPHLYPYGVSDMRGPGHHEYMERLMTGQLQPEGGDRLRWLLDKLRAEQVFGGLRESVTPNELWEEINRYDNGEYPSYLLPPGWIKQRMPAPPPPIPFPDRRR